MIADRKARAVKWILHNDVYQTDSGFYQRLEAYLNRLPLEAVLALETLVELRLNETADRVRKELAPAGSFAAQS